MEIRKDLEEINALLEKLGKPHPDDPYFFPDWEEYKKKISIYGRRKITQTLYKEVELRYNAEKALEEYGFVKNKWGKWIRK